MKNSIKHLVIVTIVAFTAFSFTTIDSEKKQIKTEKSAVVWKAYNVTGSEQGTINIKSGSLSFDEGKLISGDFMIDVSTINVTSLTGEYKGKLEGHLKSGDFFGVEKNPTSSLTFNKVKATGKNSYKVRADLTIKGKTESIAFDLSVYGNKANATLKIDRTKYGIKYGSSSFFDDLKDKAIYDEFDLIVDLEF